MDGNRCSRSAGRAPRRRTARGSACQPTATAGSSWSADRRRWLRHRLSTPDHAGTADLDDRSLRRRRWSPADRDRLRISIAHQASAARDVLARCVCRRSGCGGLHTQPASRIRFSRRPLPLGRTGRVCAGIRRRRSPRRASARLARDRLGGRPRLAGQRCHHADRRTSGAVASVGVVYSMIGNGGAQ